jgi:hypothetical protein
MGGQTFARAFHQDNPWYFQLFTGSLVNGLHFLGRNDLQHATSSRKTAWAAAIRMNGQA